MDASTIAAIATPPGEGGVGMIRISGPEAPEIAAGIFRRGKSRRHIDLHQIDSHRLLYGTVIDPATGTSIDEILLAWMAAPNTYTREHTVELTCHGGPVPLQETLRVVLAAGARHAEPGEFTLRAFLNGRLSLTQAEAVLNVVSARTSDGLRLAIADLAGDLAKRIRPARDALVTLLAYLDATADFPEDEIPGTDIDADLATADTALREIIAGSRAGQIYREGAKIALIGKPNVGKSSLLNALLRSERAIVTPIAGTTRDVITESVNLDGLPATLIDTAGIAESTDPVERLGIERSRHALSSAFAAVLVLDGSREPDDDDLTVARLLADRIDTGGIGASPFVIAVNKSDLPVRASQQSVLDLLPDIPVISISTVTATGLRDLERSLAGLLRGDAAGHARPALITTRQRAALDRAAIHLNATIDAREQGFPIDLLATDVRAALHAIGEVTGENIDESVLTEIFSRFCIGK